MRTIINPEIARSLLRKHVLRLADFRQQKIMIPASECWGEREILFSLVHQLVSSSQGYDPMLDPTISWASWYLRYCENFGKSTQPFVNEEAVLFFILGFTPQLCGKDFSSSPS